MDIGVDIEYINEIYWYNNGIAGKSGIKAGERELCWWDKHG